MHPHTFTSVRGVVRASVTDGSGLSAGVTLEAAAVAGQLAADQKLGRLDSSRQPRLGGDPLLRRDKRRDLDHGNPPSAEEQLRDDDLHDHGGGVDGGICDARNFGAGQPVGVGQACRLRLHARRQTH